MIRQSPVSVAELAAAGQGDRPRRDRRHAADEDRRAARRGRDPGGGEAEGEVPGDAGRGDADPRGRREDRRDGCSTSSGSRLSTSSARRPSGERIRGVKGLGAKVEENVLAALEKLGDGGPGASGVLLSEVLPVAEELARDLLEAHPACDRVTIAGSARRMAETCKDIDLIATATEPGGSSSKALAEHPLAARRPAPRARPGRGSSPTTGSRVDLRIVAAGRLRQPAPALHRLEGPQRRAARARGQGRASRSPSTGSRTSRAARSSCSTTEAGRLRAPRPRLRRAGAARGPRRDRRGRGAASCPTWSSSATSRATCTATRPSPTAATRSRRWPRARRAARLRLPRGHRPLGDATGSATTSRPTRCSSGSRRSAS